MVLSYSNAITYEQFGGLFRLFRYLYSAHLRYQIHLTRLFLIHYTSARSLPIALQRMAPAVVLAALGGIADFLEHTGVT